MEIEKTEFGLKATVPLITEDEMKIINNDFDNTINKFLDMIIKDKDLATAQYIIKKQQEQINELKRNSIPKKKIEDRIEEQIKEADEILEKKEYISNFNGSKENQKYYFDGYKDASIFIQELLEEK